MQFCPFFKHYQVLDYHINYVYKTLAYIFY